MQLVCCAIATQMLRLRSDAGAARPWPKCNCCKSATRLLRVQPCAGAGGVWRAGHAHWGVGAGVSPRACPSARTQNWVPTAFTWSPKRLDHIPVMAGPVPPSQGLAQRPGAGI